MNAKEALRKTVNSFCASIPIIIGVLLLVSVLNPIFQEFYPKIFTGSLFFDPLIGALAGSISFGIPIISYVTGGELLQEGVSLLAVTAFILAWSSVGLMMIPLEITNIGKKFAIWRNLLNFIASILISILVFLTIKLLQ